MLLWLCCSAAGGPQVVSRRQGRYLMLEQMVAAGVSHVFGNPGTTEQAFMDALNDYPQLRYILALHEGVAVGIADGYSRLSPVPAFVQLHITPGLGNAMGMLYNAYWTRAPLVVYVGQHPQRGGQQEPILWGDVVAMARSVTKWAAEVQDAADLPMLLRRAFQVAAAPPQGPVLLSVPTNIMDEEAEAEVVPPSYARTAVRPDPEALEQAAQWLAEAQAPVIVAGAGAAHAHRQLAALAELVGARVHVAFGPLSPLGPDHPLYAGPLNVISAAGLRAQLSGADLLLAVGAPLFRGLFPLPEDPLPAGCRVVQIDLDPWELGKNWPVQLAVLADPAQALAELREAVERRLGPGQREAARKRQEAVAALRQAMAEAMDASARPRWDQRPMAPARFAYELAQALHPDTLLYDESITVGGQLGRHLRLGAGQHFRAAGGGLGPGMPAPIGLKLACPQRPVLAVVGDGSALYTIQALWTAAHHQVPVTWVIANNASYRILKLNLLDYLGEGAAGRAFLAMDLASPAVDFVALAKAFGVKGVRLEEPQDIGPAVREAQQAQEPRLIDVVIDGSVRGGFL
jgi:benzoylformate decarboxylase